MAYELSDDYSSEDEKDYKDYSEIEAQDELDSGMGLVLAPAAQTFALLLIIQPFESHVFDSDIFHLHKLCNRWLRKGQNKLGIEMQEVNFVLPKNNFWHQDKTNFEKMETFVSSHCCLSYYL